MDQLQKVIRQISLVTGRGTIHSVSKGQRAQASFLSNETKNEVPIYQQYGFKSVPAKGSGCVAICNGNRENLMIIATKDLKNDPELEEGDVALFTKNGLIKIKNTGAIEIKTDKLKLGNNDIIGLLSRMIGILNRAQFPTVSGPQPLPPEVQKVLAEIKTKLDSYGV